MLYRQIWVAFLANPGLNALIIGVLLIGILLSFRQVIRLFVLHCGFASSAGGRLASGVYTQSVLWASYNTVENRQGRKSR